MLLNVCQSINNKAVYVTEDIAYDEVTKLITKKAKDIIRMSPEGQTYLCEAWHALVLYFAPKHIHYSYQGQLARSVRSRLMLHFHYLIDFVQ